MNAVILHRTVAAHWLDWNIFIRWYDFETGVKTIPLQYKANYAMDKHLKV